jgi:hypothetical protein
MVLYFYHYTRRRWSSTDLLGWRHFLFIINKEELESKVLKKKKKAQYQLWLTNESSSVDLPSFCLENNAVGESDRLSEPVPSWSRESARGRARR